MLSPHLLKHKTCHSPALWRSTSAAFSCSASRRLFSISSSLFFTPANSNLESNTSDLCLATSLLSWCTCCFMSLFSSWIIIFKFLKSPLMPRNSGIFQCSNWSSFLWSWAILCTLKHGWVSKVNPLRIPCKPHIAKVTTMVHSIFYCSRSMTINDLHSEKGRGGQNIHTSKTSITSVDFIFLQHKDTLIYFFRGFWEYPTTTPEQVDEVKYKPPLLHATHRAVR